MTHIGRGLGPFTERRFRAAFRRQAIVTKEMAARLIGRRDGEGAL